MIKQQLIPSLLFGVALLLSGGSTHAQGIGYEERAEIPEHNIYIHFGEYSPTVSTDTNIQDYYDVFYGGKATEPYMAAIGWDWYFFDAFGLLGISTQIGSWKANGKSRVCYSESNESEVIACDATNIATSSSGNDSTTLNIMPVGLGLVYRLDILKRLFNFPFVPYGKGSLQYFFWSNYGGSKISKINGEEGRGATAGYQLTAGLAMALGWIEPNAAAKGRATNDIYDSYLYAEWSQTYADHFGKKKRFNMSAQQINFGLAIELF